MSQPNITTAEVRENPDYTTKPANLLRSVARGFAMLIVVILSAAILFISAILVYANVFHTREPWEDYAPLTEPAKSHESAGALLFGTRNTRHISAFDTEMQEINPDYICWITIDGTTIDYPVVRGSDNKKYLGTSFYGVVNQYGTLFMDYRCVGEDLQHIIIYGQSSSHGDLFGNLWRFLDRQYLLKNPTISIKVNDRVLEYEIFSARRSDINDPAYFLDFKTPLSFRTFALRCGAPPDAAQIITLSAQHSGSDNDERIIVQGVLR
jgi:sortase B